MSNISDLKDALVVKAGTITDDLDKLDCLATIDDWYACRTATASGQAGGVVSYSIAGRTITRQPLKDAQLQERALWLRIQEYLYRRGIGLVDCRNPVGLNTGVVM